MDEKTEPKVRRDLSEVASEDRPGTVTSGLSVAHLAAALHLVLLGHLPAVLFLGNGSHLSHHRASFGIVTRRLSCAHV